MMEAPDRRSDLARARGHDRRGAFVAGVVALILYAVVALRRGHDVNWDQLNYHFAGSYAVLHDNWWWNIAPSQMQTWINPLGYLPDYWLAGRLSDRSFQTALACVHAINVPLIFLMARRVAPGETRADVIDAALATLIGMTAATLWGEVGTTYWDIISGIFVLPALLLVLGTHINTLPIAVAGLLIGLSVGFKLPNGVYAIGMAAALLATRPWPRAPGVVIVFGLSSLAGFVISDGWWMFFLWREYHNPIFPYFNSLFHSPWLQGVPASIASGTGADTDFLPRSPIKALEFPLKWAVGRGRSSSEYPFRDPRLLVMVALFALLLVRTVRISGRQGWKRTVAPLFASKPEVCIIVFYASSFLLWIAAFAIQRYIVPLEAISGVMILIAMRRLVTGKSTRTVLMALVSFALLASTRAPNFGYVPFGSRMTAENELRPLYRSHGLYVMLGRDPTGYAVPALPSDARFVRIEGNMPLDPRVGLGRRALEIIAHHAGPIMTLAVGPVTSHESESLARFGLAATSTCRTAEALSQHLMSCELRRGPVAKDAIGS